jgi:uncharacterized protein
LHGVSLSIGSSDPLNLDYIDQVRALADRIEAEWVSDHLCWTGVDGVNLHDLLPLPFTEESLNHVVRRIDEVQHRLGRRIALENVSSYLSYTHADMSEWEFLRQVTERADCLLLLDINNVYVSSINHEFDARLYLQQIPPDRVQQFHLAGHRNCDTHLIDTHDEPVSEAVWDLYAFALSRFGSLSTMIERDDNIPEIEALLAELDRAREIATRAQAA